MQVRPDWGAAKLGVMRAALSAKFRQHEGPRAMLLATAAGQHGPQQVGPCFVLVMCVHRVLCLCSGSRGAGDRCLLC